MQEDIQQLKNDVEILKKWKEEKSSQQLSYPLDIQSIEILKKFFLHITSSFIELAGPASRQFTNYFVQQDTMVASIGQDLSEVFTVVAATDVFTVSIHPFANGDTVTVFTSDTLPNPLSSATTYYVVSASGMTFKLSTSLGGTAVDITNTGAGIHYINYL